MKLSKLKKANYNSLTASAIILTPPFLVESLPFMATHFSCSTSVLDFAYISGKNTASILSLISAILMNAIWSPFL